MNNIRTLREREGLTQKELAEYLKVSRSSLSLWENDKIEPDRKSMLAMAERFRCSIDHLINRTPFKSQAIDKQAKQSDDEVYSFHRNLNKMTPEQRQKAKNVILASLDDFEWEDFSLDDSDEYI